MEMDSNVGLSVAKANSFGRKKWVDSDVKDTQHSERLWRFHKGWSPWSSVLDEDLHGAVITDKKAINLEDLIFWPGR